MKERREEGRGRERNGEKREREIPLVFWQEEGKGAILKHSREYSMFNKTRPLGRAVH